MKVLLAIIVAPIWIAFLVFLSARLTPVLSWEERSYAVDNTTIVSVQRQSPSYWDMWTNSRDWQKWDEYLRTGKK